MSSVDKSPRLSDKQKEFLEREPVVLIYGGVVAGHLMGKTDPTYMNPLVRVKSNLGENNND